MAAPFLLCAGHTGKLIGREWDTAIPSQFRYHLYLGVTARQVLKTKSLAERVGFEPTLEFPLNTLSKRAPSATRPSLRSEVALRKERDSLPIILQHSKKSQPQRAQRLTTKGTQVGDIIYVEIVLRNVDVTHCFLGLSSSLLTTPSLI